jgi:hypothetical protein
VAALVAAAAVLLGAGVPADGGLAALLAGAGALFGFASAMLVGFAANLEILHDIRAQGAAAREAPGRRD